MTWLANDKLKRLKFKSKPIQNNTPPPQRKMHQAAKIEIDRLTFFLLHISFKWIFFALILNYLPVYKFPKFKLPTFIPITLRVSSLIHSYLSHATTLINQVSNPTRRKINDDLLMGNLRPFHGSPKSEGKDGVGSLPRINTIIATFTLLHVLRWPIYQLTMVSFVFVQSVWSCSDKLACWWKFSSLSHNLSSYWYFYSTIHKHNCYAVCFGSKCRDEIKIFCLIYKFYRKCIFAFVLIFCFFDPWYWLD